MKAIGGYFGLELNGRGEFHKNAFRLNTGRNALEYILRANSYKKIFIPYYTCDALLESVVKLKIEHEFYSINHDFEPIFDIGSIEKEEAFLYTNYFGLKGNYIHKIAKSCKNLIVDNAQAFYSLPIKAIDTFYSARKFFGVPDGAYLYSNKTLNIELKRDISYKRFDHLLMRVEKGAEYGYSVFNDNEKLLEDNPIKKMSRLTQKLLASIDYRKIAKKRIANFNYLNSKIKSINHLNFSNQVEQVPMTYPLLTNKKGLRNKLISEKIYTPQYWPNVLEWAPKDSLEYKLADNLVFLPIDQRYGKKEMDIIVNVLRISG